MKFLAIVQAVVAVVKAIVPIKKGPKVDKL